MMRSTHKWFPAVALFCACLAPHALRAQDTSNGTLTATATVESSISITFENDPGGCALTGAGTSAATLAFGTVSAYEALAPCVNRAVNGSTDYTVDTLIRVKVQTS